MVLCSLFVPALLMGFPVHSFQEATPRDFCENREDPTGEDLVFEKVYLHLDRDQYVGGEDIWFKAYLVDARRNRLSAHSGVLYVDLVSPALEVIDRRLVRLEEGTGTGDFHLSDSLLPGTYLLQAYTSWMRNFGRDFFHYREISIMHPGLPAVSSVIPSPPDADSIDLQFFPEGGSLVADVPTRVAFKAVDRNGSGCRVDGIVTTREGKTSARLQSSHLGMGSFILTPEKGARYRAILFRAGRHASEYELPEVFEEGYVMNVSDREKGDLSVIIKTNRHNIARHDSLPLYLQVRTREGDFLAKILLVHTAQRITLQKSSFPPGISHLVLYDGDFIPYCERLVYIDPSAVRIMIEPDKKVYSPREKTVLNIKVTDENGVPLHAEMSLAAVNASAVTGPDDHISHIRSYLYLESELKGTIEDPGYYFNDAHDDRHLGLDLLLLTQGWRDFAWKYHTGQDFDIRFPAEKGLTLTGHLSNRSGKKPMVNASISLVVMEEDHNYFNMVLTDSLGGYAFRNLDISGAAHILLSAADERGRERGMILLDPLQRPGMEVDYLWKPAGIREGAALERYVEEATVKRNLLKQYRLGDTIPIEEVMVTAQGRTREDGHQRIYGKPDHVVEVGEHERHYRDIFDLIRGRVPGVTVSGQYPDYQVLIRGISNLRGETEPLYMLDGLPVGMDIIMDIPVTSVDKVEVLKNITNLSMYGSRGANGVILVYSKKSENPPDDTPVLHAINTVITGYDEARIFYAPRYDAPKPGNRIPDLRTTIHWVPSVKADDTGAREITYFNADQPSAIWITLEGMTADGIPLYFRTGYRVE